MSILTRLLERCRWDGFTRWTYLLRVWRPNLHHRSGYNEKSNCFNPDILKFSNTKIRHVSGKTLNCKSIDHQNNLQDASSCKQEKTEKAQWRRNEKENGEPTGRKWLMNNRKRVRNQQKIESNKMERKEKCWASETKLSKSYASWYLSKTLQ